MKINGIDISALGIKLFDRVIKSNQVVTTEEWLDGDIQPTYIRQQDKFKDIALTFLILDKDENNAFLTISKLTAMLKHGVVRFDDIDLDFDVNMTGAADPERLKNGNFTVRYNLTSGYARGEREVYTTDANLTNSFKLTVLYYKSGTTLLANEVYTIRQSSFTGTDTLASIGIDIDRYKPNYFNSGYTSNFSDELTYENLLGLTALIINYRPIEYNLQVNYFLETGLEVYYPLLSEEITFTQPVLATYRTIGELINTDRQRPDGYRAVIDYDGELTVEGLVAAPINVYYKSIENERSKNIVVSYYVEDDNGTDEFVDAKVVNVRESNVNDGTILGSIISINANYPGSHYDSGLIDNHSYNELVTYDTLELSYNIHYKRASVPIYIEYYYGVYPAWNRYATSSVQVKYNSEYEENFSLTDLGIDINRYHDAQYHSGQVYGEYSSYDDVVNAGVIQIYYVPIDYTIGVNYVVDGETTESTVTINALDFLSETRLSDIVPIAENKPEGYQFDPDNSYTGEITLSALTQASPITIAYKEIEADRTKNIVVRYKQELASAYSTINTSLITVSESDCVDGVRLMDIISLNQYKPEYYENGVVDGASSTAILTFESLGSSYDVLYLASTYLLPVRYYRDEVSDTNWIGSESLSYKVISFSVGTTLYDLGLNVNANKPSYGDDGQVLYTGPVNFAALQALESINIVYETIGSPDDEGIDYPHRFLFLEHNDLGDYETLYPTWTMNHAYINTGVAVEDMSKLTVVMECDRVDRNVPLQNVNAGYAYLFGSSSPSGQFYMRFNNQTQFGENLDGVNKYQAKAGLASNILTLTEEQAIGFSSNSGIYQQEREGYSIATFTYSNQLQTEHANMPYPLYLFAMNNAGHYVGGLAGIGIYSCRIYYDGTLIRDFIPVETYDLIGTQVSPSNCLYDKVTKTFFEDETGLNSFNIWDDDRYTDTNLVHKIGHCYVQYYKGNNLFKTDTIWFRGNDFEVPFNPYSKFFVDENQPAYTDSGVIENYSNLVWDFEHMNNSVYVIRYAELDTMITVNYYQDDGTNRTLIQTEEIGITEEDFYSVPTFGDLVRLNKYKPEGYKTDYTFPEDRVTLNRVLSHSPYDIVYVPETNELIDYTTEILYKKNVYGFRQYEDIGTITLHFDQTDFRDGEYIDFYIDKNAMKPPKYYLDGTTFEWYEMDERLTTPSDLKEQYVIVYEPEVQYVNLNYYTDEIDDANLVASTTWGITIDEFNPEETFYLVDRLPNEYINKYKPANCAGGILNNANIEYTFSSLIDAGTINIVYESVSEPNDPTSAIYEQKILYFGNPWDTNWHLSNFDIQHDLGGGYYGARIPYIDLGYRPKDLSRLRVEIKYYAKPYGLYTDNINSYSAYSQDYSAIFGYVGAPTISGFPSMRGVRVVFDEPLRANRYAPINYNSKWSKGVFTLYPRLPVANDWVYTAFGPQTVDGQTYYRGGDAIGVIAGSPKVTYIGVLSCYRYGFSHDTDVNYDPINVFRTYLLKYNSKFGYLRDNDYQTDGYIQDMHTIEVFNTAGLPLSTPMANPLTVTMDAYNNYISVYEYSTNNTQFEYIVNNEDEPIFADIEQPKGSLSLFRTTNPTTGKVNIMPWEFDCYAGVGLLYGGYGRALSFVGVQANPYNSDNFGITFTAYVTSGASTNNNTSSSTESATGATNNASSQEVVYTAQQQTVNINYMSYTFPAFPQLEAMAIWGLKIYDQDKLVRWLIPVAEGDVIYDYTMPANGLFDLITEIFFGNSNVGGTYSYNDQYGSIYETVTIRQSDILPLRCIPDPMIYGKITTNYYDYNNNFIANQFVNVPTWFNSKNTTLEDVLKFNDYKPDDYHLDGMLDIDTDLSFETIKLSQIYEMGTANVYYKLRTYSKTIKYYASNTYLGSQDIQYSVEDINNASTLSDLGINVDLFYNNQFSHGRIIFNEQVIADDDITAFIDAPSPIVVYDKLSEQEAPNLLYVEYYRGGAYDDSLITLDANDNNYFNCELTARVLNPSGAIQYSNHYHSALYENETYDYFVPYIVEVINHYTGIHSGPGRVYPVLANIVVEDTYTIIAERNGWGKLKEYRNGWILLNQTRAITGPGQNPDYDVATAGVATIPFSTIIDISRMTVDRLWAYAEEYDCWIKTADISYDQAGKLFDALAINVIDLTEIDWNNVSSINDVFNPEAYRLRFHNASGYTYSGALTQAALSALHSVEIVYPETIYNYTCIYYKDNKAAANELGRSAFSCTISDWNPDWDTFISTSWQVDENEDPINPTLYRDTPVILTWDYFGFDRNLYKPTGYYDGIYLWNPRTWDKDNVKFTFDELIRCGTQYVVYPIFNPDQYKLWVQRNYLGQYSQWRDGAGTGNSPYQWRHRNALNPGVEVNLADDNATFAFYTYQHEDNNIYDVYVSGEIKNDMYSPYHSASFMTNTPISHAANTQYQTRLWGKTVGSGLSTITRFAENIFNKGTDNFGAKTGDQFIANFSNHRDTASLVVGFGNSQNKRYYIPNSTDFDNWVEIFDNTNLAGNNLLLDQGNSSNIYKMTIDSGYKTRQGFSDINGNSSLYNTPMYGVLLDMISYHNFEMIHYWCPVPKGLWYRYNGEDLRIPDNGLFDLLTGDFVCSYRTTDGAITTQVSAAWTGTLVDGNDLIYNRDDEIGEVLPINLFDNWEPTEYSCNYIVQLNEDTTSHRKPDAYDNKVNDLRAGLILPVSKYTNDTTNKVVGEWYYSSGQWFESNTASIYAGDFNSANLVSDYKAFSLVPGAHQNFAVYLNPHETETADASYGSSAVALQNYYTYTVGDNEFFFDGRYWIPKEYTSFNRIDRNVNYAVARNTDYYQFPIADESYKIGVYLYGDRTTVLYVAANDTNWGYTGLGWVQIENNLSEVL